MANIALPPNETTLTEEQVGKGLEVSAITPNYLKHGYIKFTLQNIGKNSSEMKDITILSNYKNLQEIDISGAKIQSLAAFKDLHTLHDLDASNNELTEVLDFETPDGSLLETSWENSNNLLMGIRHPSLPVFGIQFHPESVGSPMGNKILLNFINKKPVNISRIYIKNQVKEP